MGLFLSLKTWLYTRHSKFKAGDSVELITGGPLMVVIEILPCGEKQDLLINCKWFDSSTGEIRTNLFKESSLKPVNWYNK